MDEFREARLALFRQHTITRPTLDIAEAVQRLVVFRAAVAQRPLDVLIKRVGADRGIQDAAIALLKYYFTPLDLDAVDPDADYDTAVLAALDVVPAADAAHKAEFIEVLFNLAHPADHRVLADAVFYGIPAAELEKELPARVTSQNELHVYNALNLPYYFYGRRPDYALSAAGRSALARAGADLETRGNLNPLVREALTEFKRMTARERLEDPPAPAASAGQLPVLDLGERWNIFLIGTDIKRARFTREAPLDGEIIVDIGGAYIAPPEDYRGNEMQPVDLRGLTREQEFLYSHKPVLIAGDFDREKGLTVEEISVDGGPWIKVSRPP